MELMQDKPELVQLESESPETGGFENSSQKRKLEECQESDNNCSKKMKIDGQEKAASAFETELALNTDGNKEALKPDSAGDKVDLDASEHVAKTENDLSLKAEEKIKEEEMDEKKTLSMEQGDANEANEKPDKKRKENDPDLKQFDSLKPVSAEQEEKKFVPVRRYPTRGSKSMEERTASDLAATRLEDNLENPKEKTREILDKNKSCPDEGKASSVNSDCGSDKENVNVDAPIDLSNAGTPDVIMLSDEEETEDQKKRSLEKMTKMKKLVRHLQTELRNEEAKLVLLKKLRQSQLTPQVQELPQISNNGSQQPKQNVPRQPGGPPPLVRGSQQGRSSSLHVQQQQQQQQEQNRSSAQGQMRSNLQGPPPLVGASRSGSGNTNGHSTPGIRGTHMSQHVSSSHRPLQQQQPTQHQPATTPPQNPIDSQTPAQRQAAAKLALRKQLEKTLLQIPPPKPPAPEMNFIPSLACPDFVLLLGLEEVVNHIIDLQLIARGQKSPDEKFICNPFTCVQCGTDYTPVWKREKPGSKNVICEHCVTWNQKRALKQEHTNRLKSAFVKALQQEQEIERMQAQTPTTLSTPTPSATPPSSITSTPPQSLAAAAAASNVVAAAAMSMNSASFRASAEQVRQHHNFLQQAHQAQFRAGQPLAGLQGFGARSPFPYTLPYVKQADIQRQYLLDMIPRAGMSWKP